jgi:hypothetical protein
MRSLSDIDELLGLADYHLDLGRTADARAILDKIDGLRLGSAWTRSMLSEIRRRVMAAERVARGEHVPSEDVSAYSGAAAEEYAVDAAERHILATGGGNPTNEFRSAIREGFIRWEGLSEFGSHPVPPWLCACERTFLAELRDSVESLGQAWLSEEVAILAAGLPPLDDPRAIDGAPTPWAYQLARKR